MTPMSYPPSSPYPSNQPPPEGQGTPTGGQPPYGTPPAPGTGVPQGSQPPYGSQPAHGSQPPYGAQPPAGGPGGGMPPMPPGGGGMPPVPPGGGFGPQYSPIEAIVYGFRKFGQHVGVFLVLGLLLLVVTIGVQFLFNLMGGGLEIFSAPSWDPDTPTPEASLGSSLLELVGSLLSSLFGWIVGMAIMRGALDVVDTGRVEIGQLFNRIPWGQALLAGILVAVATLAGLIVFCVGAIVVTFFLYYTNAAVLDGKSATDAISASFTFVKDNLAENLLLCLLGVLAIIATICTCYLGGIVLGPVMTIAVAYTWRHLQGRPVAP